MNRRFQSFASRVTALLFCMAVVAMGNANAADLEEGFLHPADEYRPRTWWHWLNENITQYGITRDLEAMKRIGLKGAHMANVEQGGPPETHGDDVVASPAWLEKVEHAAKECERLGLTLGMASCAGWVSGGPWMTPELSMQEIVWRHTFVKGPVDGKIELPQPRVNLGYYRDIAVLAFPSLPGDAVPLAALHPKIVSDIPGMDWSAAIDGDPETFVSLPRPQAGEKSRHVAFEFEDAVPVRSVSLQMQEDSRNLVVKLFSSENGQQWVPLVTARRWRSHFVPGREEMIDGFAERRARFVKLEIIASSPPVPMKLYEFNFQSARLSQTHTKAARQRTQPQVSNPSRQVVPEDQRIQANQILDLTEHLRRNGELACSLPEGEWTILRFGHTSNGNKVAPASKRAAGLESDKMSVEALEFHLNNGMVRQVYERLGSLTGKVMVGMNVDSWEAGCQTWTRAFPDAFFKRRGYDCRKWLVTLTGRFVESVDLTERFLWDYRRTIGDLIAENFYGTFRKYCNEWGVAFESEAPGIGIPIQADQIQCLGMLDIPQGEFWLSGEAHPVHGWTGGQDNTKEAAAASHVYGKKVTSCEAFTSFGHHDGFTQYPYILQPVADRQFCKGMNEIVFHRYAHQPDDRVPGMSLGQFGLNFERTQTWWEQGRSWIDYLSRCQYMLRQGRFFADVCYYYGEDVPGSAWYYVPNAMDPRKKMQPVLPKGHDYDVCDRTTLDTMSVEDGSVMLPCGMRYAYLVLPDHARFTPAALKKVHELVVAGATVVGPRPSRSPSMNNYPRADETIRELADKLWPKTPGPAERQVGKGRVITGKSFETIFQENGLPADFSASLGSEDGDVRYIHRTLPSGELYFVASSQEHPEEAVLQFRVSGKIPEVWDPSTGRTSMTPMYRDDGRSTFVPLRVENYGSKFILFRKPSVGSRSVADLLKNGKRIRGVAGNAEALPELSPELLVTTGGEAQLLAWEPGHYEVVFQGGGTSGVDVKGLPAPETVPEKWTVTFQEKRGAPEGQVTFDQLGSWTARPEEGIKYFSGTASYEKGINVSRQRLKEGRRVHLDLGDVKYLAEVFVNDQPLGVLWKPPFRVDITDAAKPGANKVVIKVTNLWKNRLVGDAGLSKDARTTWAFYDFYKPDAPLLESGMLGPVRVLSSVSVRVSSVQR